MIRKLILFVLLMAAGLGVMHFVIGWENFARIRDGDSSKPIKERDRGESGFVVSPIGDDKRDAIVVAGRGALRIPRTKEVSLPGGGRRLLTTYVLSAANSRPDPAAEDRMTLLDVEVEFFNIDEDDPANPRSIPAGVLTAKTADIVVGHDENGRPSILEDRDMDLTDVVLSTIPSGKVTEIEMRVAQVLLRHTDAGLAMRTRDPRAPFTITVGGDDPMTVTGEGLEAMLPSDNAPPESDPKLELHVAANPVLIRGNSTLRAQGPLDYVESVATGIGEIELRDRVRVDGLLSDDAGSNITVSGGSISATLARRKRRATVQGERSATWLTFRLIGRPATMTGNGVVLRCTRVDAQPGIDNEPCVFTASGAPVLEQSERDAKFEARRIHLVRVRRYLGALHRPFGFAHDFGSLAGELLVFEDAASVDEGRGSGAQIRASNGMRVLRAESDDGPLLSVGRGSVEIERDGLRAIGNDGFRLVQHGERQSIRLGPEVPDVAHEFTVTRGGDRPVAVSGSGSCVVDQRADGAVDVRLRSPNGSLQADLDGGQLRAANSLDAMIDADGTVTSFVATGSPCRIERSTQQGRIVGSGETMRRLAGGYELIGSPASIERGGEEGEVLGDRIYVYEWGGPNLALRAESAPGAARTHVTIDPSDRDKQVAPIELDARSVTFLPYRVPGLVLGLHAGNPRLHGWSVGFAAGLRAEQVVARDDVEIEQAGEDSLLHARGDVLWTQVDGSSALLRGSPSLVEVTGEDGREITAIADAIRIGGEVEGTGTEGRLVLLRTDERDPLLFVRGPEDSSAGIGRVRISCAGEIDAGRARTEFLGPVLAREVDDNGVRLPDGLEIRADSLVLVGDPDGAMRELIARGDVNMRMRGSVARGDELTLDIRTTRATLRRQVGFADITMPNGQRILGKQLEVDYQHMLVTGWMIHIEET